MTPGLLRLLLALIVVLHHSTPLRLGAWAVGLFFCLSGYWIAEMWARKYARLDRPYSEFVISRWWRRAPVLFATTAVAALCVGMDWIAGSDQPLHNWHWLITQPAIVGSTVAGRLLPPAWSLDVEMQFYLVAPVLLFAVYQISRRATLAVIGVAVFWCAVATAKRWAGESPRLDVWVGVFLIGMAASAGRWRWRWRWRWPRPVVTASIGLTLLVMTAAAVMPASRPWILLRGSTGHPLRGWLPTVLTVGTILSAVSFTLATTANPSGRLDRFFGDQSYPFYLFHLLLRQWHYPTWEPFPGP